MIHALLSADRSPNKQVEDIQNPRGRGSESSRLGPRLVHTKTELLALVTDLEPEGQRASAGEAETQAHEPLQADEPTAAQTEARE